MKISELVVNLEKIKEINGDISVRVKDSQNCYNDIFSITVKLHDSGLNEEPWKVELDS